ncbi:hypothetical protein JW868_00515 [Candidatus Woesearchaeota archaeon]|nr:hypothetical protein [Candidatus Woesearchaeota archaeon]
MQKNQKKGKSIPRITQYPVVAEPIWTGNSYMGVGLKNSITANELVAVDITYFMAWMENNTLNGTAHMLVDTEWKGLNWKARGINEETIEKELRKSAAEKISGLERIAKAHTPSIEISQLQEVVLVNENYLAILENLIELYETNPQFRRQVNNTVPKRLLQSTNPAEHKVLAEYCLREVALILSHPSTKVGPATELPYDTLAQEAVKHLDIQDLVDFDIDFRYPYPGTPYRTESGLIAPYASRPEENAILFTDNPANISRKIRRLGKFGRKGRQLKEDMFLHLLTIYYGVVKQQFHGTQFFMPGYYEQNYGHEEEREAFYELFYDDVIRPVQETE